MENTSENKINFILPGFLNISRNEILINIYENYPYITMDNSCIHSFYGNFPSCDWNGGRLCLGEPASNRYMKKVKTFHNKHNIIIALTMTNLVLDSKHLDDEYCNDIMENFNDKTNEVLISDRNLEDYILMHYPIIKINRSITSKIDPLLTLGRYNLTLIPSQKSNDEEYIGKIPLKYRKNIEVLCNDPCVTDCKYKYSHYEELCKLQLGQNCNKIENKYGSCKQPANSYEGLALQRKEKLFLPPKKLQYMVDTYGIKYFKINGREKYVYHGYDNIVYFCIKNEYQNDILCYLLERMMLEYEKEVIYQTRKYGEYIGENDHHWHERIDVHASR